MLLAALTGFIFGFVGSIPIAGPIAVLVFGRGVGDKPRSGLYLAAGSAIAEGGYAYLAFWGFSAFLTKYAWVEPVSFGTAAVILIGLGIHLVLRKPKDASAAAAPAADPNVGNKRSFFLGFTITALNPTVIANWTAAVTSLYGLHWVNFDSGAALPFSAGACLGITSWFATLLSLLTRFRQAFSGATLDRVIRIAGYCVLVLSLWFVWRFVHVLLR
jgi:threonine/homoserine/homoserine lactone efflux protein